MVRRKRRTVRRSKKLMAKIKRDGIFKGTGDWAGSQIGGELGKVTKKAVPALMLLAAISAATPPVRGRVSTESLSNTNRRGLWLMYRYLMAQCYALN